MDQELAVLNTAGELVDMRINRSPDTILAEARLVSVALAKYAHEHQLYKAIGTSKHLMVEGWQMCAHMYRVTSKCIETRLIDYGDGVRGFEATAVAVYMPTGVEIGRADAMCLSDEDNWGLRPKYEWVDGKKRLAGQVAVPLQQLRSMAQTRAQSKVLSTLFKWVAKIGGFAGTPAEEMTGDEDTTSGAKTYPHPPQAAQRPNAGALISEAQAKRIFGVGKGGGLTNDQILAVVKRYGFETPDAVTRDKYEALCAELQAGGKTPSKPDAKTTDTKVGPPKDLFDYPDWDKAEASGSWQKEFIKVGGVIYHSNPQSGNYQEWKG